MRTEPFRSPPPRPRLRAEALALRAAASLRPLLPRLQRHDPDLHRQLRRAAASVALNLAEGAGQRGGHRVERWRCALGSARECVMALQLAAALGYLPEGKALAAADRFDHVAAVTYKPLRG